MFRTFKKFCSGKISTWNTVTFYRANVNFAEKHKATTAFIDTLVKLEICDYRVRFNHWGKLVRRVIKEDAFIEEKGIRKIYRFLKECVL